MRMLISALATTASNAVLEDFTYTEPVDSMELPLVEELWLYFNEKYLNPVEYYPNLDMGTGTMLSVRLIIIGLFIGLIVACFVSVFTKQVLGVIDSKALSTGQAALVLKACDMVKEGKSAAEIEADILEARTRVNTSFVPDSLDYLHKGGRVSGMVKTVAGMFKIHPQILMDDGQLVPGKKYKGKMSVLIKQYVDDLKELYPNYDKSRCFVTHSTADRELVDAAIAKVKETFEFDEIIETVAGSIITSHCGKGTLGVLFVYNK